MRNLIVILCCVLFFSCKQDVVETCTACENEELRENLPWLGELISKAETDRTGNYAGFIWLEKYKGRDIFVTNMGLGSGGIMYRFFDCDGNHLVFRRGEETYCPSDYVGDHHFFVEDEEDFGAFVSNMKLDVAVYSPF
ncbi:MAG: hypothetical protein LBT83_09650 [Tannerella sp.]|jgi:hypothetical protein|nr:hypothetical protein [Tannerella sp.]